MEKRVKIRKTVFGGAIARICCLALCLCLGLSISMTAQAASGKKVTPVTMAAVVGEEKTVTQQAAQAAVAAQQAALAQQQAAAQQAALAAQQAALAQQAAMQQAAVQQAAVQQAALAQAQAEQKAPIPAGSGNVIFVGDSRTGQMANAVGGTAAWPGTAFVACFGGGVDWLSTAQAKKDVDQYVTPGSVIILNYGVNDLSRHNDYITTINRYAQDWISKGATVYFASVGPVGENEYGKRNWAVEYFNNQLNNRLDARIGRLNLYVFLTGSGYTTQADGLHYDGATYAAMFRFLMQSIGRI